MSGLPVWCGVCVHNVGLAAWLEGGGMKFRGLEKGAIVSEL